MSEYIDIDFGIDDTLPDPVRYQYYKNLQNRTIVINEEITDELIETAVLPFLEMDNDGTGEQITVLISTVGGSIYPGFALVDVIENAKSPVVIKAVGMAASMGTLLLMAGKHNKNVMSVCGKFTVGLLHSGSQYLEGTAHSVRDTFDFSQAYENKIRDYIISHSNIDNEFYEKIERKEYWMDADEMLRLGIVDKVE